MSKSKGYYGGDFGGRGNPLEDRHLKSSPETTGATNRVIFASKKDLNKLKAEEGKGILQIYLYTKPVAVGDVVNLQGDEESLKAQVTAIPEGINADKNKRTTIEVKII